MPLTFAERAGVVAVVAQTFAVIGTVAYVETRPPDERPSARRQRYANLASSVFTASMLGALWLSFDELEDKPLR